MAMYLPDGNIQGLLFCKEHKMNIEKYTDKYFTYTREILERSGYDPWVAMQVFIRKGPGRVYGIDEAVDILRQSGIQYVGGRIWALPEGSDYQPGDVVMKIEAPLRMIVEYETIYLGIISESTTLHNRDNDLDLATIEERMREIVSLVGDRPVYYFGARHWHWRCDKDISEAAMNGGAAGCSTGARGEPGLGTMPHALVVVYGDTAKATSVFDRYIDKSIKRVVLVDTFNREIDDAKEGIQLLWDQMGGEIYSRNPPGLRIDTCGENVGQYCHTKGVSVELARKMKLAMSGYSGMTITLSSGFANVDKVKHFIEAENALGMQLFDSLGVGQLWEGRSATADIIVVDGEPKHKTGRPQISSSDLMEEVQW